MKVHHIGYYVPDIEGAQKEFASLGYMPEGECTHDEERRVYIQFLRNDSTLVELVAPAGGCTLFPKSMRKNGAAPYHICYECEDMDEEIKDWQKKGFLLLRSPSPAPAMQNRRVSFLYSGTTGMIEFVEI